MKTAKDLMHDAVIVGPDAPVVVLAQTLLNQKSDGACVVKDGELLGVVTTMDLIFQEKDPHLPQVLSIFDALIPLEAPTRMKQELEKITGAKVKDIMTKIPVTVGFDTSLSKIATIMVEQHITLLPVIEDGVLVGAIAKADVIRAAFHLEGAAS